MEGDLVIQKATRLRWWFHLVLLGLYPVVGGLLPALATAEREEALLPPTVPALLTAVAFELVLFSAVFLAAWWASRASAEQLLLKWREGARPVFRGFFYAIGLRLVLAVVVMLAAFVLVQVAGVEPQTLEQMQPRGDAMVETRVLAENPLYFVLCLTVVSFLLAGFREELWRAGVLAGMNALFPDFFHSLRRQLVAVGIAAALFGLGHLPQGTADALMTTVLGFGLGAIMVYYRSIWDAVFAHGFFNAGTFFMMYLLATRAPHLIPGG